jgi:hypothetical protein
VAAPATRAFGEPETQGNAFVVVVVVVMLIALASLLFAGAAISASHVPRSRFAVGLQTHRADLVLLGVGAAGTAFALCCVQLVAR